jgi:hypothetical protein
VYKQKVGFTPALSKARGNSWLALSTALSQTLRKKNFINVADFRQIAGVFTDAPSQTISKSQL